MDKGTSIATLLVSSCLHVHSSLTRAELTLISGVEPQLPSHARRCRADASARLVTRMRMARPTRHKMCEAQEAT